MLAEHAGPNEDKINHYEISLLHGADDLSSIKRLAARTNLALLPVGPPDAHGPHLPIGTDHTAARELCNRAAHELEAEGAERLIAPLLTYCLAEGARPFPGTISVRAEIVAGTEADICRGLAASGFRSRRATPGTAERLYSALGRFVAGEGASLFRSKDL